MVNVSNYFIVPENSIKSVFTHIYETGFFRKIYIFKIVVSFYEEYNTEDFVITFDSRDEMDKAFENIKTAILPVEDVK